MARTLRGIRVSSIIKVSAVVAISALVVGVAVVAQGFDVKQTPVNDSSIWALQVRDGNRYSRINTDLLELDTIKTVKNPSDIVQTASTTLLLSESNEKVASVDRAQPQDFTGDSTDIGSTPSGTKSVVSTGKYIGYLTDTGRVYAAAIDGGVDAAAVAVDPFAADKVAKGEKPRVYAADSIAIGTDGILYSFSLKQASVVRFDIATGKILGQDAVPNAPTKAGTALTVVGDQWALLGEDGAKLWRSTGSIDTGLTGTVMLQGAAPSGSRVYVADSTSLVSLPIGAGSAKVEFSGANGTPAAPSYFGGQLFAAWLGEADAPGTLWGSKSGDSVLDYGGLALAADPLPVFRGNGSRMILNDAQSGWVWSVPTGELVASSQNWGINAAAEKQNNAEVEQASEVLEPKPPIAVDDKFGARAGALVVLPVLLNDHDPNEDVLTVVPASIQGLDAGFGSLTTTNNAQDVAIQLTATASGSATFRYQITDGTKTDGLMSDFATVTVTVFGDEVNTAPVWCGVEGCTRDWPTMQVRPGGTAKADVLTGWVDPEGDQVYVAGAVNQTQIGAVAATPEGTLVYQHPDANGAQSGTVPILVRVSDVRGAVAEKTLTVEITATPTLTVESFAALGSVGEPLRIDPATHVTGASGVFSIVSARSETDDGSTITINNGGATFDFTSPKAGSSLVSYTVKDEAGETIALVRITIVPADSMQLATSPVTVFVRPKTDTTVDLFTAVSNPGHKVLMLSEALPTPAAAASLDVNVVDQRLLRVKGSTGDGMPGVLGVVRYTVSDGTGNATSIAHGEATVVLLPVPTPQAPIAIDDAVTVRAGAQIDIPVLANDIAPDGNTIVLNPDGVENTSGDGLAFVAGTVLRYLAPAKEGSYELYYGVYSAGSPDVVDTARVAITVLPSGENRAPQPHTLIGRVLAGQTVSIPFDSFGVDPDGDTVKLDRVTSQPASGSATISATGNAISYTSVSGFAGPVEFSYRVTDSSGEAATSTVRVGVLDAESDPSPVTFSDYVEVQVGASSHVAVLPAANDIDPAGGALDVVEVLPDAPAGSEEYTDLKALIGTLKDNEVSLQAGTALGTRTFTYSVRNATGDTGIGLIVMKVVRESVPDHPQVADSYLTLDDRASFGTQGMDVVTGKVTWNSGQAKNLVLTLWGKPAGLSVSGWKIRGELPEKGMLVPFKLTGKNFLGDEVSSYGFLTIPGKNDIILTLKAGIGAQKVKEKESVTFDMKSLMSIPAGEELQIDGKKLATTGTRPEATCALDGTRVTYTAGAGAPWTDYCTVPVKLAGQSDYTQLLVSIAVQAEDAQPELRPASLTLSPGAAPISYDLAQMTTWQGHKDFAGLTYAISYDGDQFSVTQAGSILTLTALDASNPGRENTVRVSISSHPDAAPSTLSLKVGPAPADIPRGATVAKECSQAAGTSCVITVIGGPGEANLYKTPLTLVSVGVTAVCVGVTVAVENTTSVRATWAADTPGGKCEATFVVKDAQGKLSAADRNGSVLVDLQGYPKVPGSVTQVAYADKTLTLKVDPSQSSTAYPSLSGFAIYNGATKVADCSPSGVCPPIGNMENGAKATFEARAVNAVGESRTGITTQAWSYAEPTIDSVSMTAIYKPGWNDPANGNATVAITTTDSSVASYSIALGGSVVGTPGKAPSGPTNADVVLPVGSQTVVVTASSRFTKPVIPNDTITAQSKLASTLIIGAPTLSGFTVGEAPDSLTVNGLSITANPNPGSTTFKYFALGGASPACSANPDGSLSAPGGSADAQMTLERNVVYRVYACVSNGFGFAMAGPVEAVTWAVPDAPQGFTYSIAGINAPVTQVQGANPDGKFTAVYNTVADHYGVVPTTSVKYCLAASPSRCGPSATPQAADASKPFTVSNAGIAASCRVDSGPAVGGGQPAPSVTISSYDYFVPLDPDQPDGLGTWPTSNGGGQPQDGTVLTKIRNVVATYTWPAATGFGTPTYLSGLSSIDCT